MGPQLGALLAGDLGNGHIRVLFDPLLGSAVPGLQAPGGLVQQRKEVDRTAHGYGYYQGLLQVAPVELKIQSSPSDVFFEIGKETSPTSTNHVPFVQDTLPGVTR